MGFSKDRDLINAKNLLAGKLTDSEIKEFLNNFWKKSAKKVGVYIENGINRAVKEAKEKRDV